MPDFPKHSTLWARFLVFLGLAGLGLFWLLTIPEDSFIFRWDRAIFQLINAAVGRSAVLDWSLLVTGSRGWYYGSLGAMLAFAMYQAWRTRARHHGRRFGYLLCAGLLALAAEEIADEASDLFPRPAPWVAQAETWNEVAVRAEMKDFLDYGPTDRVPDENFVAWFFVVLMLLPRMPRTASITLGLLALYTASHLILGTEWTTTFVSSVFFASALTGVILFLLGGPIEWTERKAEKLFAAALPSELLRSDLRKALEARDAEWQAALRVAYQSQDRQKIRRKERFWHELVGGRVLPLLGHSGEPFTLSNKPPGPKREGMQPSRYVRFLTYGEEKQTVVVKAAAAARLPWSRPSRLARYLRSVESQLYLERLGFPVARTYFCEDMMSRFGLRESVLIIEDYLSGSHLPLEDFETKREAIRLLARMHQVRRQNWGALSAGPEEELTRASYVSIFLRREVIYALRRMERHFGVSLDGETREEIWHLFEGEAGALLSEPDLAFRLIHGDVSVRNFLKSTDGTVRMIDFVTVAFDLPGIEIVRAPLVFTEAKSKKKGRPKELSPLWTAYFEEAGAQAYERFTRQSRLALARFSLRELAWGRARLEEEKPDAATLVSWIRQLFAADPRSLWGGQPEEADWSAVLRILGWNREEPSTSKTIRPAPLPD
ncbi:MAG: phosphotransferase [Sumerlaeia bacterium]